MSLEVKRNFLQYTKTVYRCVLEDEENNITICCHLSEDDNESDLDMCLIDENGRMGSIGLQSNGNSCPCQLLASCLNFSGICGLLVILMMIS